MYITEDKFKQAVEGSRGKITEIARQIGVSRLSIYNYMEKHEWAKELVEEEAEKIVDMAEDALYEHLRAGNMKAVETVLLKHKRGRERGYGEKQELQHTGTGGGSSMRVEFVEAKEGEQDGKNQPGE